MDLKKLKLEHPDVFEAAFQEGVTAERDRVTAHLTLGASCGDMKTAREAIESGAAMTQTFTAKYLAASANRADRTARQADTDAADKVVTGATSPTAEGDQGPDLGDKIVALIDGDKRPAKKS